MRKKLVLTVISVIICILSISNISFAGTISSDIDGIDDNKYPGYKSMIKNLESQYPNFHFQVYYTGIDWTEAVTMEYQGHGSSPKNLFSLKTSGSASTNRCGKWYCPICGENKYDTGWYCASKEAIEYMMDPRNSLSDISDIFQFKNLEYADVSAQDLQNVISKEYSSYSYINNQPVINAITTASTNLNMNGFSILAKIINEQGKGSSVLVKGTGYNGNYVGYYNFFNIGAYGNGTANVIMNGLRYAQAAGWNSAENSIIGGSQIYKTSYIGKGQNTLYYQRFNVIYETSLFSHQYQQDVMGAETSSILMKRYYADAGRLTNGDQYFIIPIYENMPTNKCARPSTTTNSTLQYETATVKQNNVAVCAGPNSSRIIAYLNINETVKVLNRATTTSLDGNYWDEIVTDTDGTYGYIARTAISNIPVPSYVFDAKYYADTYSDLKSAFGYDENALYQHFINYGINEGRRSSYVFDVKYYLENNAGVKRVFGEGNYAGAYYHFLVYGCNELRKSSDEYDGKYYKTTNTLFSSMTPSEIMAYYMSTGRNNGDIAVENGTSKTDENTTTENLEKQLANQRVMEEVPGADSINCDKILFDATYYYNKYDDLRAAFGKDAQALYNHFLTYGINEGRAGSSVLDLKYYLDNNAGVKRVFGEGNYAGAYYHFVTYGCNEFRKSSEEYDGKYYKEKYSNLSGLTSKELLTYYVNTGRKNGNIASQIVADSVSGASTTTEQQTQKVVINEEEVPGADSINCDKIFFDATYYYNKYDDLRAAFGKDAQALYNHFLTYGINEGRAGSSVLDLKYYLDNNAGVKRVFGEGNYAGAYYHFVTYGCNEYRKSSPEYDGKYYKNAKSSNLSSRELLNYYVTTGRKNGDVAIQN